MACEAPLRSSTQDFLDASEAYDRREQSFEASATERLSKYADPNEHRAREIREAAAEVLRSFGEFGETSARVSERVAFAAVQQRAAVAKAAADASAGAIEPRTKDGAFVGVGRDVAATETFERQVVALSNAMIASMNAIDAIQLATNIVRLRQAKLEAYLGETPTIDAKVVLAAIKQVVAKKVQDQAVEEILKKAAEAVGNAALKSMPWGAIAGFGIALREELAKVTDRYVPRGELDDLFDFRDQLKAENRIAETNLELIDFIGGASPG
jgi:hypothetical protein